MIDAQINFDGNTIVINFYVQPLYGNLNVTSDQTLKLQDLVRDMVRYRFYGEIRNQQTEVEIRESTRAYANLLYVLFATKALK